MPRQSNIRPRRGTAAAWTSANPVLDSGEVGLETDTGVVKTGDGVTAWASLDPILSNTFASVSRVGTPGLVGGQIGVFAGDSITAGSGSSNASTTSYVAMVPKVAGMERISKASVNGGVAGETAAQVLARVPTLLSANPAFLHLQVGTNDASNSVTAAAFAANVIAIRNLCAAAGVRMSVGLVPPRASSAGTTVRDFIKAYNVWLRAWAPAVGVRLADTFGAVVDAASGYLAAANDSGDGTHPSDAGHLALANAVAPAITADIASRPWYVQAPGGGLCSNPLMSGTTNWGLISGTSTTRSNVAASNGDVPYGGWMRFTLNNSGGGVSATSINGQNISTGWSVGDVVMACGYIRGSQASAINKIQLRNQAGTIFAQDESMPSATPGPWVRTGTIPSGSTTIAPAFVIFAAAGATETVDIGAFDVFNLTTMGLVSLISV